jgi:hypothetical protein
MLCVAIVSSVTWLGCTSDEAVSSSKKETSSFIEAQEKEQASKANKNKRTAPGPKSIKGKVFGAKKDVAE